MSVYFRVEAYLELVLDVFLLDMLSWRWSMHVSVSCVLCGHLVLFDWSCASEKKKEVSRVS